MSNTEKIRLLNDDFRKTFRGGRVMLTRSIAGQPNVAAILEAVQKFDKFTPDADPWSEHDMAQVEVDNETFFWKIDYFNLDLSAGSENPADPDITSRVLTIMMPEDL